MDVILHIGAHRCATTTFQDYIRRNMKPLRQQGIGFWGPGRTRKSLFRGLIPGPGQAIPGVTQKRAFGRIRLNLACCADHGLQQVIVSDENMMGGMIGNRRARSLYPAAGERMARFAQAFDGTVRDVVLNIRAPDLWWSSALSYGLSRGFPPPTQDELSEIAAATRGWRDVITDVACAVPDARIWVLPFETFAGRPDAQLAAVTGHTVPRDHSRLRLNASPRLPELRALAPDAGLPGGDARWMPFTVPQAARLRDRYAADLAWLQAGADGLAWLLDDPEKKTAGPNPPPNDMTRGRRDDQDRRLAGAG